MASIPGVPAHQGYEVYHLLTPKSFNTTTDRIVRVVKGLRYDTATATLVFDAPSEFVNLLYRTAKGNWFILYQNYSMTYGPESVLLEPYTAEAARDLLVLYGAEPDVIAQYFTIEDA